MSEIKGLVFDLDGVITDTAERHYLAWKRIADRLGIVIDREWNERLKGISRTESLELILTEDPTLLLDGEEKEQLLEAKNAHYLELIAEITAADILPGIPELLEEAKSIGYRMAIASASKNAPLILERLGLSAAFDAVVDPEALTYNKPHPEIFERAAGQDAEFGHHLGEVCAKEGSAVGVNWAFAPVVDIDYNCHNPITNVRTYGSDPETVLNYAQGFVDGVQQNGVAASIKHFPGDGIDFRDQHLVTSVNTLPLEEWRNTYGKVYSGLIEAGALSVMIGHIALPAVQKSEEDAFLPGTLSPVIMQELLREELGFNGVITSDATPMVGFCATMERRLAVPTAIAAGCDIFLFNKDLDEDIRFMKEGIANGILTPERIDEAVTRILAMKAALHLPEKQAEARLVPAKEELVVLQADQHIRWAKEAAYNGITLVKDTVGNLPLRPEETPRLLLQLLGPYEESNRQIFSKVLPLLEKEGFCVTLYQPEDFTTGFESVSQFRSKYDAVLYLANVENRSNATTTRINWYTFFGLGNNIPWFVDEVPTVFASLGNPYHLMDVPMVKTYINAYDNHQMIIEALVAKLIGKSDFKGVSPIDPYCGLMDARR